MDQEFLQEQRHLESCLEIIRENINLYEEKEQQYRKEITELFQAVRQGDGDSYGQLAAGQNILKHTQNALRKNRAAVSKTCFGRIDYYDETYHSRRKNVPAIFPTGNCWAFMTMTLLQTTNCW